MFPAHQNLVFLRCCLWVLQEPCCCVFPDFSSSPFIFSGSCYQCGQCLVSLVLVNQSGTTLHLSWVIPSFCQRCSSTKLLDTFPVLSPEMFQSDNCLPPAHYWGSCLIGVWFSFPNPRGNSHFGVVLALIVAVYTLPGLWLCFKANSKGCAATARTGPVIVGCTVWIRCLLVSLGGKHCW